MADSVVDYPYETRLNILHAPLEVIDESISGSTRRFAR